MSPVCIIVLSHVHTKRFATVLCVRYFYCLLVQVHVLWSTVGPRNGDTTVPDAVTIPHAWSNHLVRRRWSYRAPLTVMKTYGVDAAVRTDITAELDIL